MTGVGFLRVVQMQQTFLTSHFQHYFLPLSTSKCTQERQVMTSASMFPFDPSFGEPKKNIFLSLKTPCVHLRVPFKTIYGQTFDPKIPFKLIDFCSNPRVFM